jgi:hypothetical protein
VALGEVEDKVFNRHPISKQSNLLILLQQDNCDKNYDIGLQVKVK